MNTQTAKHLPESLSALQRAQYFNLDFVRIITDSKKYATLKLQKLKYSGFK